MQTGPLSLWERDRVREQTAGTRPRWPSPQPSPAQRAREKKCPLLFPLQLTLLLEPVDGAVHLLALAFEEPSHRCGQAGVG